MPGVDASKEILSRAVESARRIQAGLQRMEEAFSTTQARIERMAVGVGAAARSAEGSEALIRELHAHADLGRALIEENARLSREAMGVLEGVGKSVLLIQDLAKNVTVLSLNASIEAARAGVHGVGFKVVAREIKTIADHAKNGAARIQAAVNEAAVKVVAATRQADSAHEAFLGIQEGAQRAVADVEGLRAKAEEEKRSAIALILDLTDVEESNKELHAETDGLAHLLDGPSAVT